ncbi:DGQHR domain-containing protein [Candidatus Bathyarchaeota archaeon A05DMB-2]|nr:DGQHR domain-containing protein [Candidatus Bathyarchaeota archaeon A05DMB-2]
MICSCCGYEINGKMYPVENGEKFVCEKCWNDPNLFFPEKIQQDERLRLLSKLASSSINQRSSILVKVIKLVQKDIEMYVGKMKVSDILDLYELDKFKEEELEGYQREQYEERTNELVEYLSNCPLAVMPALLVSLRKTEFKQQDGDFGILKIPRKKGSIWIIDGQHRVGGFGKIREKFVFSKSLNPSLFSDLMDYELPIVFIDSIVATGKIGSKLEQNKNGFTPEDIERTIFFIVNKTQKGISPSLKDALLYRIKASGIQGLSIIEKESWRIIGAEISIALNRERSSPLEGKINVSGKRDTGKPIQLNSFVSSLQPLLSDKNFVKLSNDDKLRFLENYWKALKKLFPEAFDKKTEREYMILKALGVYSLHWFAKDIFQLCLKQGLDFRREEILTDMLLPLRSFDWNSKTSPLSALGGMKGASKAHDLLLDTFDQKILLKNDRQTLKDYVQKEN